ncbi:MAG: hypothetical protein HYZ24_11525 [Chloroflexi bacterium]|nr:hypothetical protein [Chloroflexota bacterium]
MLTCGVIFAACNMWTPQTPHPTPPTTAPAPETPTPSPVPTRTAVPTATLTSAHIPVWVVEFSDPILVALKGRVPDFQDDFSPACIYYYHRLETCPPEDEYSNFEVQFAILNQGWFYQNPENHSRPFYVQFENEMLSIKLPEGKEKQDSMVYNPYLIRENFVMNFDLHFGPTQPEDAARFEFGQSADQSVALDIFKNETWALHWGNIQNWETHNGAYDAFPPERLNITLIMLDTKCAVILNNLPLDYVENCRPGPMTRSSPWAVSFHLLGSYGREAAIFIDNVKLWDLDKVNIEFARQDAP